ncbi:MULTISPECIES: ROK family protein [unclassified Lactobacillus]|uniref:ROK family protein n=1 Tax=unclassified Lactobacillus TaxID=2620435 RepID=UPI000BEF069F|nr:MULTISPECIES: ROK family protein [unclassified Lactobacillus]PEG86590.1 hypothetical protein CP365_07120 [Lactobacillus sp. UMNPBX14]PEH02139.1 hypothetical protein CP357_07125 [Lactobacillus sp. UMNPBX6]
MNLAAIDIGGTTIKIATWKDNQLQDKHAIDTPKDLNGFYQALTDEVDKIKKDIKIEGVAISSPGAVNKKTGIIGGSSAIAYIHNFKIVDELEKRFGLPVSIENDANSAALGELAEGSGKGCDSIAFFVIGTGIGGALAIGFLVPFFWFFGVHGGLIMGSLVAPMLQANTADNARLFAAGKLSLANGAHIVTNEFYNNFINLTGSGITIGLIVFTLVAAKSVQLKSIGKLELVPGIFNINEPFLFGLPIVMNPMLAVPFFLTPLVVAASTYLVIKTGIVPPLNGIAAPWTTPAIISGFLIGGWKMAIWQFCTLLISTAIYWPFAKKYDKVLLAKEQKEAKEAK